MNWQKRNMNWQKRNMNWHEVAGTKHKLAEKKHEVSVLRNTHEQDTDRAARQIVKPHPRSTSLALHDVIPFEITKLNAGNAFDPSSHVFTCPFNGIYVFQSALMSELNELIETEIVIDGVDEVSMFADGSPISRGFDQGFNAIVNTCQREQRVWVRSNNKDGHGMYSGTFSSFSGFLLYELEIV